MNKDLVFGMGIGFLFGFAVATGLCDLTASAESRGDSGRPYFGFTQDGIEPIDRNGNTYGNRPSIQTPQGTSPLWKSPC